MLATPKLVWPGSGMFLKGASGARIGSVGRSVGFWLGRRGGGLGLFILVLCWSAFAGHSAEVPAETARGRVERIYTEARQEFLRKPGELGGALAFAVAAFDLAELDEMNRAAVATEGINASRAALVIDPLSGEASYYLAVNLGQLARTKKLGALKLLDEMEREFLKAIDRSPKVHFGGAHRSLGMMYEQAPGWPVSLGSNKKARLHLEKAVELVPEFPGNHLALLEAYVGWGRKSLARERLMAAKEAMKSARETLTGVVWEASWAEWEKRLKRVEEKSK